jgi:hypothetical protein
MGGVLKSLPVIFHHIPKCGGTSLLDVLSRWFTLTRDYPTGWDQSTGRPADLSVLSGADCLCGHFDRDETRLMNRYPRAWSDRRVRIVTFLRDPLAAALSLYRWEGRTGYRREDVLERHLMANAGHLARSLGVTRETYRAVLARYDFIGLVEEMTASVHRLADCLGKSRGPVPWLNATDPRGRAPHRRRLRPAALAAFTSASALDYEIHALARERLASPIAGQAYRQGSGASDPAR